MAEITTRKNETAWRNRITGHGMEAPGDLAAHPLGEARLHGDPSGLNFLVASSTQRNKIGEVVGALPITLKGICWYDMVDMQVSSTLRCFLANLTLAIVSFYRCLALAFPIGRVFPFAAPSRPISGVSGTHNPNCSAIARAIEMLIFLLNARKGFVLSATGFAGQNDGISWVRETGGTSKTTKNMGSLLSTACHREDFATPFASESLLCCIGAFSYLVVSAAKHILSSKSVNAPAVHQDGISTIGTCCWQKVIDAFHPRPGKMARSVFGPRVLYCFPTTTTA